MCGRMVVAVGFNSTKNELHVPMVVALDVTQLVRGSSNVLRPEKTLLKSVTLSTHQDPIGYP